MSAFRGRKVIPLLAAGVTAGGLSLAAGLSASAATVTAFPAEAWTGIDTPLAFAGVDPVNGLARSLAIDFAGDDTTCVVNVPATNDYTGDCAGAHFYVPIGTGTITVDDSQVAYVGGTVSGDYTFTITGKIADVQAALASITYVPALGFTTDGASPVPMTVEGYDAGGGGLSTEFVDIYVTDTVPAPAPECPEPETTEPEDTPDPTDPPVETTEPQDTPETTEPEDTPETTEPEDTPETTEPDDTPTFTIPDDFEIPTIPTIPIPQLTIPIPIVTPPPVEIPSVDLQTGGPFGFSRPIAAPQPDPDCPPETTTPGGNGVPGGTLPETGSPTLVIAAFAGLLTASGVALLAARGGKSER